MFCIHSTSENTWIKPWPVEHQGNSPQNKCATKATLQPKHRKFTVYIHTTGLSIPYALAVSLTARSIVPHFSFCIQVYLHMHLWRGYMLVYTQTAGGFYQTAKECCPGMEAGNYMYIYVKGLVVKPPLELLMGVCCTRA